MNKRLLNLCAVMAAGLCMLWQAVPAWPQGGHITPPSTVKRGPADQESTGQRVIVPPPTGG